MTTTPRIRVASIIKRLHVGGDENRLLSFATHVDRDRFDHLVVVVVPTDAERDRRIGPMLDSYRDAGVAVEILGIEVRTDRIEISSSRVRHARTPFDYAVMMRRLVGLLRSFGADVADVRLEFGAVFGTLAARLAGVPVVVATGYETRRYTPPIYWALGQAALASVDAIVSDAQVTVAEYDRWRSGHRARLAVIPNGVRAAVALRSRADVRASLDLSMESIVVGQLSRVIPRKGQEVFIESARIVAAGHPNVAFVICGFAEDRVYRDRLVALATECGLANRLRIIDYPGPVGDILGAIDIFAHLSHADSSPIAILESMSAGLPAVVTRVGGTAELVVDGVSGFVVPRADPVAAATRLVQLVEDRSLAAAMGAAATSRYLDRHQPEQMARAHEDLFLDLLRTGRRPRLPLRSLTDLPS